MNRIEEIKLRREKALADGSFFLRVPTWLTAGDGRDFCAAAPDDIEFLLEKLDVAVEALSGCSNACIYDFPGEKEYVTSGVCDCKERARTALEKIRGEK